MFQARVQQGYTPIESQPVDDLPDRGQFQAAVHLRPGDLEEVVGRVDIGEGALDAKQRRGEVDLAEAYLVTDLIFLAPVRRQAGARVGRRGRRQVTGLEAARVGKVSRHVGGGLEQDAAGRAQSVVGVFGRRCTL